MAVEPHDAFQVVRPDEVAECWNGVMEVGGLYEALWLLVRHYDGKPRSEVNDDFEDRALKNWWGELGESHQVALNELAERNEREMGI